MPLTRRGLLTTAAAASVAASVLNPEASAMQAEEKRLQGNIKHSVVFWCFNIAGEKWDIDKTCSVAKSLGCKSVEICGPAEWPTLKKYGLTCAIAANGMPGAPFMKGLNNPKYHDEVIATTTEMVNDWHAADVPAAIPCTRYK